jgi:hypothetical protein
MGSGRNESLSVMRSARTRASNRTPVHFWLSVPYYEYDLECGTKQHIHTFQSRTPLTPAEEHDDFITVWCNYCQSYTKIDGRNHEPLNRSISTDEFVGFEQDKGILRERIALAVQDEGFLEHDAQIREFAIMYGVPVAEIKKINAGLRAPSGLSGEPDICKAGLHEMTSENTKVDGHGRRGCLACYRLRDKEAKARLRAKK